MATEHGIDRQIQRLLCWFSIALILFLIALQGYIRMGWDRNERYALVRHSSFYRSLLCVYILYALLAGLNLARNYAWPSCSACVVWVDYLNNACYVTSRIVLWIFLVLRAKMSQGLAPVVSPKFFKYFPKFLAVLWAVSCVAILDNIDIRCRSYHGLRYCQAVYTRNLVNSIKVSLGVLLELSMASLMLFLFVKPLLHIERSEAMRGSRESDKIRTTLRWNILMSLLCLSSTICVMIGFMLSEQCEYLWPIDRALNVSTSFLMLGRNRQWIHEHVFERARDDCCPSSAAWDGVSITETIVNFRARSRRPTMSVKRAKSTSKSTSIVMEHELQDVNALIVETEQTEDLHEPAPLR